MYTIWRILAIIGIFLGATVAWLVLAAVTSHRTSTQDNKLGSEVGSLWGVPQVQEGPAFAFAVTTHEETFETVEEDGKTRRVGKTHAVVTRRDALPSVTTIQTDVHLDRRLKGLLWYALYDVVFDGAWTYQHDGTNPGALEIRYAFPVAGGIYDDFRFIVDGRDLAHELRPDNGNVTTSIDVTPGQAVTLQIHYKSRGLGRWGYRPSHGVASLQNFKLALACDFDDIDYPEETMSPSRRQRTPGGWILTWDFKQVLTGSSMGLTMPVPIQPGELATTLAASAPVSLLLFFIVLFVLSVRYQLDIHPLNYLGIAAAFFAFHLLFAYSVDHLHIVLAFALASGASIFLVVSYLRLVVSPRFAYRRVAVAQLVYQVGFSIAHFWSGYTGLTISVLATLTLFLLMQLTGRTRWSDVLGRKPAAPAASAARAPIPGGVTS